MTNQKEDQARYARWENQVARCRPDVYRLFVLRGFLPQEAEDLTQDTMIKAYRFFDRIRLVEVACVYVRKVAGCVVSDYFGKKKRRKETTGLYGDATEDERDRFECDHLTPAFGNGPEDPEDIVQRQEGQAQVRSALQDIPERDRNILVLHYLEGHSFPQIAEILNTSDDAVKMAASRARKRLREKIAASHEIGGVDSPREEKRR